MWLLFPMCKVGMGKMGVGFVSTWVALWPHGEYPTLGSSKRNKYSDKLILPCCSKKQIWGKIKIFTSSSQKKRKR